MTPLGHDLNHRLSPRINRLTHDTTIENTPSSSSNGLLDSDTTPKLQLPILHTCSSPQQLDTLQAKYAQCTHGITCASSRAAVSAASWSRSRWTCATAACVCCDCCSSCSRNSWSSWCVLSGVPAPGIGSPLVLSGSLSGELYVSPPLCKQKNILHSDNDGQKKSPSEIIMYSKHATLKTCQGNLCHSRFVWAEVTASQTAYNNEHNHLQEKYQQRSLSAGMLHCIN